MRDGAVIVASDAHDLAMVKYSAFPPLMLLVLFRANKSECYHALVILVHLVFGSCWRKVRAVIHLSGFMRDEEVIVASDAHDLAMVKCARFPSLVIWVVGLF